MSAVTEGQPCQEFPPPKESISYQPFYGKYATTGRQANGEEHSRRSTGANTKPRTSASTAHPETRPRNAGSRHRIRRAKHRAAPAPPSAGRPAGQQDRAAPRR